MVLRNKIRELIYSKNDKWKNENLERDIDIILSYFGMGEIINPTYENVGKKFDNVTRERVRQIINKKFKEKVSVNDIVEINKISMIIELKKYHQVDELLEILENNELIENNIQLGGLLNLLHVFKLCMKYKLYNTRLLPATVSDKKSNECLYIIESKKYQELHETFKKIRTAPGMIGLANLYELFQKYKISEIDWDFIISIITNSKNSWIYNKNLYECWYLFEDRSNIIINALEKITNITDNIEINILADVIYNYIVKRSINLEFPSNLILKKYFSNSKYIDLNDNYAYLKVEKENLNSTEDLIFEVYKENDTKKLKYVELKENLMDLGITKVNLDKNLYNSPFLYVDKTNGRKNYELVLLSYYANPNKNIFSDRYIKYKNKLKKLYGETDISSNVKLRKEQGLLREWLFSDNLKLKCAICGNFYSVNSMVAAHKKKRSRCSEGERTDPNIVMPVCLYGCDLLYEKEYINIIDGVIKIKESEELSKTENDYLKKLSNRKIEDKYFHNSEEYFKRTP